MLGKTLCAAEREEEAECQCSDRLQGCFIEMFGKFGQGTLGGRVKEQGRFPSLG